MKIDLGEEIKLTRWQFIQIILICCSLGAGLTLLNVLMGLVVVGVTVLILAMPLLLKVWESSTK